MMCRAHHAHVDAPWPRRSHGLHLARFQRAQQLDLKRQWQVTDFVQEERPSVRRPEGARRAGDGAGEGALLVSEQLRLRQLARDGAAVQWNEGPAVALRELVHRPCGDLFPRSALAEQRDRKRRGGGAAEQIEDRRQGRIARDEPGQRRLQARPARSIRSSWEPIRMRAPASMSASAMRLPSR